MGLFVVELMLLIVVLVLFYALVVLATFAVLEELVTSGKQ